MPAEECREAPRSAEECRGVPRSAEGCRGENPRRESPTGNHPRRESPTGNPDGKPSPTGIPDGKPRRETPTGISDGNPRREPSILSPSPQNLSMTAAGFEPVRKRPARSQQPNVYLEPKWLRCYPLEQSKADQQNRGTREGGRRTQALHKHKHTPPPTFPPPDHHLQLHPRPPP